jgi:hypothetical protein
LSFATDTWTSPNHKAFVAVTVHFQKDGKLVAMLLDLVEVAESHSGLHLAAVFAKILGDFKITDKVSIQLYFLTTVCLQRLRSSASLVITPPITIPWL